MVTAGSLPVRLGSVREPHRWLRLPVGVAAATILVLYRMGDTTNVGGFGVEWVNDPTLGVGRQVTCALRSAAGTAYMWEPGGDPSELVAFAGHMFRLVDGELYVRSLGGDPGALFPFTEHLDGPLIFFRPMAGDVIWMRPAQFTQAYSVIVDTDVPVPAPLATVTRSNAGQAPHNVTVSAVPEPTSPPSPMRGTDVTTPVGSGPQTAPAPALTVDHQPGPVQPPKPRSGRPPGAKTKPAA